MREGGGKEQGPFHAHPSPVSQDTLGLGDSKCPQNVLQPPVMAQQLE